MVKKKFIEKCWNLNFTIRHKDTCSVVIPAEQWMTTCFWFLIRCKSRKGAKKLLGTPRSGQSFQAICSNVNFLLSLVTTKLLIVSIFSSWTTRLHVTFSVPYSLCNETKIQNHFYASRRWLTVTKITDSPSSAGQYCSHFFFPHSMILQSIIIERQLSCHTIRQKSSTVFSFGALKLLNR